MIHYFVSYSASWFVIISCISCLNRHDTVFIDLSDKPEWYLTIFPAGKVPALIFDDKFLSESLLLAYFLDEQYPEPPLANGSPLQKILDKLFIESFGKVRAYVLETTTQLIIYETIKQIYIIVYIA